MDVDADTLTAIRKVLADELPPDADPLLVECQLNARQLLAGCAVMIEFDAELAAAATDADRQR